MFSKHLIKDGSLWKSISDKKSYRYIELTNGLKAILIAAPKQKQTDPNLCNLGEVAKSRLAAAALGVRVGHFQDPFQVEGLAHFVEHTILMGNKKYPEENEFDAYLNEKSGYSNASTDYEHTIYQFEVPNHYIEESLEKFSAIFHAPLFNESSITKEIKPVDSEFKDAISDDDCRIMQLFSSLAKKGHPLSIFLWGNTVSLIDVPEQNKLNIQEEIKKFWSQYYHAQNMSLVVLTELELDKIEKMVKQFFSSIPSSPSIITKIDHFNSSLDFPYTSEFFKLYVVEPVQSGDLLRITWWLPPRFNCYKSKPLHLISNIIGHEGTGSLFSYLKRRGFIFELIVGNNGSNFDSNSYQALFLIQAKLTELGLEKLDHVINAIFYFMNQLKEKGLDKFYYDEEQFICLYNFQFSDETAPSYYCLKLAEQMFIYPIEHVLTGPKIYYTFDENLLNQAFEYLVPHKANFGLLSQKAFDSRTSQIFEEKWFGTKYRVEEVPEEYLNFSFHPDFNQIHFPLKNAFVAENFDLVQQDCYFKEFPNLIDQKENFRLWYKRDFKFKLPKACFCFLFSSPISQESLLNAVALDFFVKALTLKMAEDVYPAHVAGLSYHFKSFEMGLNLTLSGFNQKLPQFLQVLIDNILTFNMDNETFQNVQNNLAAHYFNLITDSNKLAKSVRLRILLKAYWSTLEKRSFVYNLNKDQVMEVIKNFFSHMFIDCLIQGNVTKEEAQKIIEMVQKKFQPLLTKPFLPSMQLVNQLPASDNIFRVLSLNREERGSFLVNYYQLSQLDIRGTCLLNLLSSAMNEPLFDSLRTKEGLGYYVANEAHDTLGIGGFSIIIHSPANKYDCSFIDEKIESFLTKFSNKILNMQEEEFRELVSGLIKAKSASMLNLQNETSRNWSEIITQKFCFDRSKKEVINLENITLSEFKRWSIHNLADIPTRKKLSIQIVGNGEKAFSECFLINDKDSSKDPWLDNLSPNNVKNLTSEIVRDYRKQHSGSSIQQTFEFKYLAPVNLKSTKPKIIKNIKEYQNHLVAFQNQLNR